MTPDEKRFELLERAFDLLRRHTFFTTAINNPGGYSVGDTEIVVNSVENLFVGDVITINTEVAMIESIDSTTKMITLTTDLTTTVADNALVTRIQEYRIPPVNKDPLTDDINLGRTEIRTLKQIYGTPPCYLYVSDPRDHNPMVEGADFEIYASDKYTLTFYFEYKTASQTASQEDSGYDNSSTAIWKHVLYSGNPGISTAINNPGGYASGATEIIVDSVENLYVGNTITVDTEIATITAIDVETETITLTAGLTGEVADNASVTRAPAPGLLHSLRNDRVLPDRGNGRPIVRLGATYEKKLSLAGLNKIPVHCLEQVVTVSADV